MHHAASADLRPNSGVHLHVTFKSNTLYPNSLSPTTIALPPFSSAHNGRRQEQPTSARQSCLDAQTASRTEAPRAKTESSRAEPMHRRNEHSVRYAMDEKAPDQESAKRRKRRPKRGDLVVNIQANR